MAKSNRSVERERVWRQWVAEQQQSGLGIRAFCRQKQISEPSFYAWRKELQKRDLARQHGEGSRQQRLVPVVVQPTSQSLEACDSGPLEIRTPGGFALRFQQHTDPENIARWLDVILHCSGKGDASC